MAEQDKSYDGVFAILNQDDDSTVDFLVFTNQDTLIKRVNGYWIPVDDNDAESLGGMMIPVTDDFIKVWDDAEKSGKKLSETDTDNYLRELEPWE